MNERAQPRVLRELVGEVFGDDERLSRAEIQHRATGMALSTPLRTPVETMPDGVYEPQQAYLVMAEIQREEGLWRDEEQVPLDELNRAMATSTTEGQADDPTGGEAGPAERYSDELTHDPAAGVEGGPQKPSPEGRSGPA